MKLLALALSTFLVAWSVQEAPKPAAPTPEHQWLSQLVGEWKVTSTMEAGPDGEPMKAEGNETVRAIGDLWVVAEGKATMMGTSFSSMMTVGYDPAKKEFVGTWVDSMQTHMWVYRGTLDEAKKTLSLEADGPSFDDPTKTSRYRDAVTLESRDHKVLTSSVLGADGTWTTFMTADYRRVK